jgi:hypothetical protein
VIETLQVSPGQGEFYQTLAELSFTLLGLWAVVLELRFRAATADMRERWDIYSVLLFFLLPGLMSLFAMIDDSSLWWRLVFGITATIGAAEIVLNVRVGSDTRTLWDLLLRAAGLLVYVLIFLVALRPSVAADLGLGFAGIQVEAVLVTSLLVIGVNMVFLTIVRRGDTEAA